MNTLSNIDNYFVSNTLDGLSAVDATISNTSVALDGSNSMLADLNINSHQIKNVLNGTSTNDAINKSQLDNQITSVHAYIDSQDSLKLNLTGGTLTGKLGQVLPGNNIQFGIDNTNNLGINYNHSNAIIGYRAFKSVSSYCYANTAVGNEALMNLITLGRYNTAIGSNAGLALETGDSNIYIGLYSGQYSTKDNGCSYIGTLSGRDNNTTSYVKSMALGMDVIVTASNQIKIGTSEETTVFDGKVNIQAPTTENNPTTKKYVDDADVLKLNKAGDTMTGVLTLKGGGSAVSPNASTTIDAANLTNTYITFGDGTIYNDFAYLRQIGAANDIHMALDFHDDLNDGKFSLRSINSYNVVPDIINTFFYSSPGETRINAPLNMQTHKITNVNNPTLTTDATNKLYVDTQDALKADITYVDTRDALKANITYVDTQTALKINKTGDTMTGDLTINTNLSIDGSTKFSNQISTIGLAVSLSNTFKTYTTYTVANSVSQTINLPATGVDAGRVFHFKNLGDGDLVITPTTGSTLDNVTTTFILSNAYTPYNEAIYNAVTIECYDVGKYATYGKTRNNVYRSGETIKTVLWNNNNPSIVINESFPDNTYRVWTAFVYTPKSNNSSLVLHSYADMDWSGTGTDTATLEVTDDATGTEQTVFLTSQLTVSNGGLRGATIFPFLAKWSNTSTTARIIRIKIDMRDVGGVSLNNDNVTINQYFSISLSEIQN